MMSIMMRRKSLIDDDNTSCRSSLRCSQRHSSSSINRCCHGRNDNDDWFEGDPITKLFDTLALNDNNDDDFR